MLGPAIGNFALSTKANSFPARRARTSVIARRLLTLLGVILFFCALASPVFVPLLIR
jgi:hypothetical protein